MNTFRFSQDPTSGRPTSQVAHAENAASAVDPKPLHHLPRGKNTWNPRVLNKWWFWPASVAGLTALNLLVRTWEHFHG